MVVLGWVFGIDRLELVDQLGGLGQLIELDLAAADELEDDLAELGERLAAATTGERIVETCATFTCTTLEHIAETAGLRERGAKQRAEGSS